MRILAGILTAAVAACTSSAPPPEEVTGRITEVLRDAEGAVVALTVQAGQDRYEIQPDPARDYGFDLSHLEEHRNTGDPVRVTLEEREGRLYAVIILDA